MPFQNFPYTNFQNLNLDWILKKVKEMETVAEDTQELADSVDQRFNTYDDALTNMNADIVDIENDIANGRYVPASTDQTGKYLKATEQNSYEWDDVFQIPDPANEENGKVLTVLSGVAQWATMGGVGGTKIYYYNANNQTPFNYNIFDIIEEIGIAAILPIVTDSLSNNGAKLYFPVFWNTEWTAGDTNPKLIFASIHEDRTAIDILSMAQPVHNGTPTVTVYTIPCMPSSAVSDSGKVLTVGSNGSPAWQTPSGGSAGIETAVYGTTPASDIYTWFNAGKSVRCVYGNNIYWLVQCFQSSGTYTAYFVAPIADGLTTKIYYLAVSNTTWTNASVNIGDVVHYSAQSLTEPQKAQARTNIGASAETDRETLSGTTATIDAEVDTLYLCGTMTALTIDTFPTIGIFSVVFTSGSTATTLTVPNTLHMPDRFTVEANKRYEINVLDGYAVVAEWGVNP